MGLQVGDAPERGAGVAPGEFGLPVGTRGVAVGVAAAAVALLRAGVRHMPPAAGPGNTAPRFVAATLGDPPRERTLDDYAGHPVLVNVWATWCDPCRDEMPSLERLYRDYQGRGLRIAAVSIDDPGNEQLVRDFTSENRLTFDILHDPKAAIMRLYQVRGVPETFLISRRGEIVATRFAADWSSPASRALVDSLMRIGVP